MKPALFDTAPPDVALGIDSGHVAGVRLGVRGGQSVVTAFARALLPAEAVVPSLNASNIADPSLVAGAVRRVIDEVGGRPRRIALIVPDALVKVSLLKFEKVPSRAADLDELVRWQVKKTAPFPIEQGRISYTPGQPTADGGQEFIVTVARQDLIQQYEQACEAAGLHVGLVDVASFNVINGVVAGAAAPTGDWLLVYIAPGYTTLAVVRHGHLIFFRNRSEGSEGTLTDLVHQTAMYYEDRLSGAGFERVLVAGGSAVPLGGEALRRSLEERLRLPVEPIDPRVAAMLAAQDAASPDLLDALAPLVGVLLRERKAA
ncbi:MAG: pilus assembly protein PilM [Acidobacteria bacterium]|nr:pilus assembly protein PilM [Acidobacteriota bacterium]